MWSGTTFPPKCDEWSDEKNWICDEVSWRSVDQEEFSAVERLHRTKVVRFRLEIETVLQIFEQISKLAQLVFWYAHRILGYTISVDQHSVQMLENVMVRNKKNNRLVKKKWSSPPGTRHLTNSKQIWQIMNKNLIGEIERQIFSLCCAPASLRLEYTVW